MNSQYIDIAWLTTFGLGPNNVLEYFYTSPFYDPNTNNETYRIQAIPSYVMVEQLKKSIGLEYEVDLHLSKEPHLFVIKKQNRSAGNSVEVLELFYCLEGIIYQSPFLSDLLQTRIAKISHSLLQSFNEINANIEYSIATGQHTIKGQEVVENDVKAANSKAPVSVYTDFKVLYEDLKPSNF